MRIYLSHAKNSDFQKELYGPIKSSDLVTSHQIILPYDSDEYINSKALFENKECDLVVAEVSTPSTGQGIELGFANMLEIPIICFYRSGVKISNSLKAVTGDIIEYSDSDDLISKLNGQLIK